MAGFLFVLTEPSLLLARIMLYGYVISRLAHFAAYLTAQIHDVRATLWTIGSLILIYMTGRTLLVALAGSFIERTNASVSRDAVPLPIAMAST